MDEVLDAYLSSDDVMDDSSSSDDSDDIFSVTRPTRSNGASHPYVTRTAVESAPPERTIIK